MKDRQRKLNTAGFTLIELLIALMIAALILGVAGTFLVFNVGSFNSSRNIIGIQREGQLTMNQISELLSEADSIDMDSIGGDKLDFTIVENNVQKTASIELRADGELWGSVGSEDYIIGENVASFTTESRNTIEEDVKDLDSSGNPIKNAMTGEYLTHKEKKTNLVEVTIKLEEGRDRYKGEIELKKEIKLRNVNMDFGK